MLEISYSHLVRSPVLSEAKKQQSLPSDLRCDEDPNPSDSEAEGIHPKHFFQQKALPGQGGEEQADHQKQCVSPA